MKKGFLIMIVGFVLYALVFVGMQQFYTANPETMTWREREIFNRKYIGRLKIGTHRDEVLRLLGPPDISEARTNERGDILILFYRTHHVKSDGMTTRDETTPLLFVHDLLFAWGDTAYEAEFSQ
ncbi:DUF3192 domain-containing protein [Aliidiomarina halalkaliphila]|uniref:DUF3192 domain-containing protein n=1 Tax=Aliidiomarina halalkaliphila TaxID=2593535 RepID=A0A552X3D7_9GAMM|nr:DUF3192 domain-containing protein [Aliidiomarina halalkaliphila]TRW49558.1 DUF3192 domain-containing protein [Aliidiomarina halalkaliphila]